MAKHILSVASVLAGLLPAIGAQAESRFDGPYAGLFLAPEVLSTDLAGERGGGPQVIDGQFAGWGLAGGAIGGYGLTFDGFHVGVDLEAGLASSSWEHNRNPNGRQFSVDGNDAYAISARLGHVVASDALLFVRLGWGDRDFDTDYRTNSGNRFDQDGSEGGWLLGFGAEVAREDGFFYRLEFVHADYDDYSITVGGGGNQSDNFDNASDQARFVIGYRFNETTETGEAGEAASVGHRWDGFYAGAQAFYGHVLSEVQGLRGPASDVYDTDFGAGGAGGGVFGGYGMMVGDLYLGGEAQATLSDTDWELARSPSGRTYGVSSDYNLALDGRVGVMLTENSLLYAHGGIGWGRFDIGYVRAGEGDFGFDTTEFGWRAGLGLDIAVDEDVFVRVDYTVMGYGDVSVPHTEEGIPRNDTISIDESRFTVGVGIRL